MASLRDARPSTAPPPPSAAAPVMETRSEIVPTPIEAELGRYILEQLAEAPHRRLDSDTPLFETLLDSTSVLSLASYLEQRYRIEIHDAEIVPANFSTLRRLVDYLRRKTASVAPLAASG